MQHSVFILLTEYCIWRFLRVELVTAHPEIFDGDFIRTNPSKLDILKQVEDIRSKEKDQEKKDILSSLHKFVSRGGQLHLAIPSQKVIEQAIDEGKPVWVSMQANALGAQEGGYHTVVVGGYRDKEFLVFNPWPVSHKKSWENAETFIFGIHASTAFDYDNGAILLVSKD